MNTTFEERLLAAIMEEHPSRSAAPASAVRPRPARRGRQLGVKRLSVVLAGAATLTVAFTLFGQSVPPAYAVTKNADGSVKVRILEFREAAELEAELAAAGIPAEIDYLPAGQTCRPRRGERAAADGRMKVGMASDGGGIEFEIGKAQIGTGETLVLAISVDPADAARPPVATSLQIVKGPVVPCEATPLILPTGASGDGHQSGPVDDRWPGGIAKRDMLVKLAQCMRQHGIDMPDPGADGKVELNIPAGTPEEKVKQAHEACKEFSADLPLKP